MPRLHSCPMRLPKSFSESISDLQSAQTDYVKPLIGNKKLDVRISNSQSNSGRMATAGFILLKAPNTTNRHRDTQYLRSLLPDTAENFHFQKLSKPYEISTWISSTNSTRKSEQWRRIPSRFPATVVIRPWMSMLKIHPPSLLQRLVTGTRQKTIVLSQRRFVSTLLPMTVATLTVSIQLKFIPNGFAWFNSLRRWHKDY